MFAFYTIIRSLNDHSLRHLLHCIHYINVVFLLSLLLLCPVCRHLTSEVLQAGRGCGRFAGDGWGPELLARLRPGPQSGPFTRGLHPGPPPGLGKLEDTRRSSPAVGSRRTLQTHTHTFIHTNTHRIYTHPLTQMYTHTYTHPLTHRYIQTHMLYIYTDIHTHRHTHTQIYTHTHTHIQIYTHINKRLHIHGCVCVYI